MTVAPIESLPPAPPDGDLPGTLRWHAAGCGTRSPLYAELLARAAEDAEAGGPTRDLLEPYAARPGATTPGLRLMAALHRLVLTGEVPELAPYYPSAGGSADPVDAWPVVREVLRDRRETLAELLTVPVQTNEPGRSAVLFAGLLTLAHQTGLPVRLLEIGASAGLNLRADHFGYRVAGTMVLGDAAAPLVLDDVWRGESPVPPRTPVRVVERRGCDPAPIDPTTPAGRLRLESLVWADDLDRLARLRAAIAVAERVPAPVDRTDDTVGWLADRLAETVPGTLTVVWQSVVRQYVAPDVWDEIEHLLAEAGEHATGDAPLARLTFEPEQGPNGALRGAAMLTRWPDGHRRLLGVAAGHGIPFRWAEAGEE